MTTHRRKLLPGIYGLLMLVLLTACATSGPTPTIVVDLPPTSPATAESTATPKPTEAPTSPTADLLATGTAQPTSTEFSTPLPPEPVSITTQLSGLSIEEFFEKSYQIILGRDPELLLEMGLTEMLTGDPVLTDFRPEYRLETYQVHEEILRILHQYDLQQLNPADQISYQVYEQFLLWEMEKYHNSKFEYLVTPLNIRSWPQLFVIFFSDVHPLTTVSEAEAYVARVRLLGKKIDELVQLLDQQKQAGVIPPRMVIEAGIENARNYYRSSPMSSPILINFRSKSGTITDLEPDHRASLVEALEDTLVDEVYPAYQRLESRLQDLLALAPEAISLSAYEGGLEFYQALLHHFTTLNWTAEEIHSIGSVELERIQAEMREKFAALGYPAGESFPTLYQAMIAESGTLEGTEVRQAYERILKEADDQLEQTIDLRPEGDLEVIGGEVGAFYMSGSLDGTRPGKFYAVTTSPQAVYKMKTVAYHEGIPGHHYQISLALQSDLPLFRKVLIFDGYAEGWALYAEYLPSELGWYEGDLYGDLGRLQYEALRACRMIVDTGIHTKGWSYQQAVDFLEYNTGIPRGFAEYEVVRYISYPGQAPAYLAGKIEILRLRELAEAALEETFDLGEFHQVILENGSMPLTILEEVVLNWIDQYQ